jgi:HPt (histidine-containing phosphotransfer) domain-containing protein
METILDLERLRQIFGTALTGAREVVSMAVGDATACLDQIRAAVPAGDAGAIGEAAHAIKGMSANIGALQLSGAAAQIELAAARRDLAACAALIDAVAASVEALAGALDELPVAHAH